MAVRPAYTPGLVKEVLSSFLHLDDVGSTSENGKTLSTSRNSEDETGGEVLSNRDRTAYFERVHSYTAMKWFAKPDWLCPLRCALHGWINVERDTLRCISCNACISGYMSTSFEPTVYENRCKKLEESLVNGHQDMCTWIHNPTPESFMIVPVPGHEISMKTFKANVEILLSFEGQLPQIEEDTLGEMKLGNEGLEKLVAICLSSDRQQEKSVDSTEDHSTSDVREQCKSACVLTLCGWKKSTKRVVAAISCEFCNREVGLWNYASVSEMVKEKPAKNSEDPGSVTSTTEEGAPGSLIDVVVLDSGAVLDVSSSDELSREASAHVEADSHTKPTLKRPRPVELNPEHPAKKRLRDRDAVKSPMNPLNEHRSWCPWVATCLPTSIRASTTPTKSPTQVTGSQSAVGTPADQSQGQSATNNQLQTPVAQEGSTSVSEADILNSGLPGWRNLLRTLLPEMSPTKSMYDLVMKTPQYEGLRCIRSLFKDWVSPKVVTGPR